MEVVIQITSRYFCAGVVLYNNRVQKTAPIIYYMKGWSADDIRNYCAKKGWTYYDGVGTATVRRVVTNAQSRT